MLGLLVLAGAVLYWPLQALFAHVPLSYNEGWNAVHTLRLRTGGELYPAVAPALFINYPPLSFYIVGSIASFIGDDIFAGRIVALLALGITALNIGFIARRLGISLELSIIAALAFFCFVGLYFTDYVGVNDPQWLAHAFQLTGLSILLGSDRRSWRLLTLVALLMVAGGLCKHNVLSLPIAITAWLAIEDRLALRRWLIAAGGIAIIALGLCLVLYGQGFIDQVIGARRTFSTLVIGIVTQSLLPQLSPFVIAALLGGFLRRRQPQGRFILLYVVVAFAVGMLLLLGTGVIYNALFDLVIAMMLGSALFGQVIVDRFAADERSRAAAMALAAVLLATRFVMIAQTGLAEYRPVASNLERPQIWTATIERIRAVRGPVACENLALCYWAGRSSEIEFFNFGQRALLEPGYDDAFVTQVKGGRIGLIQKDPDIRADPLPQEIEALIAATYKPIQTFPVTLLAPPDSVRVLASLER